MAFTTAGCVILSTLVRSSCCSALARGRTGAAATAARPNARCGTALDPEATEALRFWLGLMLDAEANAALAPLARLPREASLEAAAELSSLPDGAAMTWWIVAMQSRLALDSSCASGANILSTCVSAPRTVELGELASATDFSRTVACRLSTSELLLLMGCECGDCAGKDEAFKVGSKSGGMELLLPTALMPPALPHLLSLPLVPLLPMLPPLSEACTCVLALVEIHGWEVMEFGL